MTGALAVPLPRQRFQLRQHLLDVLHPIRNAICHSRRNRLLVMPEDKSCVLERP